MNGQEINVNSTAFGSWPRQLNGSLRYQRVQQQARTMSEPIMVVSENLKAENGMITESSSSGPGPPKRIPLTLQRKITPIDSNLPDIPIIFVLGTVSFCGDKGISELISPLSFLIMLWISTFAKIIDGD